MTKRPLPIKAPPKPLVQEAMAGLRRPLTQSPTDRQSVDARVGADAAAGKKATTKSKPKARPGIINR
jgi:hypothetical protein